MQHEPVVPLDPSMVHGMATTGGEESSQSVLGKDGVVHVADVVVDEAQHWEKENHADVQMPKGH